MKQLGIVILAAGLIIFDGRHEDMTRGLIPFKETFDPARIVGAVLSTAGLAISLASNIVAYIG